MSAFKKFVAGAASGVADVTQGMINDKLEARRQERLASIQRQSRNDQMRDEADFKDSRFDMEQGRALDTKEKELQLERKYARPTKAETNRYDTVEVVVGKDEFGNDIKETRVFDKQTGEYKKDAPAAAAASPGDLTVDTLKRIIANNPDRSVDDIRAAAQKKGLPVPDNLEQMYAEARGKGNPSAEEPKGAFAAAVSPPKEDAIQYAGQPKSAADAIEKINNGTIDAWIKHGLDVRQWLEIAASDAGAKDRQTIMSYLSKVK